MGAGEIWRERLLPILLFPGVLAGLLLLEQGVLLPRAAQRPPEATLALWQRHVDAHPDFAPSRTRLGQQLVAMGDRAGARLEFERALALDPDSEAAAIGLNNAMRAIDGRPGAIAQMQPFLEAHPGCRPCAQNLAADHLALGDADEALRLVKPLIATRTYVMPANYVMYDHRSDVFMLAGRIHEAVGQPGEAARLYDVAIERDERNAAAHFRAGRLALRDDARAAEGYFERYAALAPADARGPLFVARARLAQGRADAALAALSEVDRRLAAAPAGDRSARLREEARALRARVARPAD